MIGPRSPQLQAQLYPTPRNTAQRNSELCNSILTARTVTAWSIV
jgi:hypothetical protein